MEVAVALTLALALQEAVATLAGMAVCRCLIPLAWRAARPRLGPLTDLGGTCGSRPTSAEVTPPGTVGSHHGTVEAARSHGATVGQLVAVLPTMLKPRLHNHEIRDFP